MTTQPLVSIVLGSYNRCAFLKATLASIRANGMDFSYEIIVVDGGSSDGSLKYLASQKDVITIIQHNRGEWRGQKIEQHSWGYFMNLGFKCAQGKYICMISDDCLLVPGAVKNGTKLFEKLLAEKRKIGAMAFYWREWPASEQYWVGTVFGKVFVNHGLYLRSALQEVDWIDAQNFRFYYADGDLCLRLWAKGYEVEIGTDSFIEHFRHADPKIRGGNLSHEKNDRAAFLLLWKEKYPSSESFGSFISVTYHDETETWKKFPLIERLKIQIKTLIKKLIGWKTR